MPIIDKKLDPIKDGADCDVEIFAKLSKRQYSLVQDGMATIEVPFRVAMKNAAGSRVLYFSCPNKLIAQQLEEGLDSSGISWQENFVEDEL